MFHRNLTGLDLHEPTNVLVENHTGATLAKGRVVALDGFGTCRPKVRAISSPGDKAFGVISCDILDGKSGYVTVFGIQYHVDTSAWASNAVLYSDNTGHLTNTVTGIAVAVVIKVDATTGILFVVSLGSFIDPETTAWNLEGNGGTDPTVNFLGTLDLKDLVFRTNNALAAKIDASGRLGLGPDIDNVLAHFYQKSHLGYALSGIRQDTFALETLTLSPQSAYTVTLPDNTVARVEFVVVGRSADGAYRCMFKRTGLFYRDGGNVQIQGTSQSQPTWISDQTVKSDNNLDVSYTMGVATVSLNVKSAVADSTFWTGHVLVEILATS